MRLILLLTVILNYLPLFSQNPGDLDIGFGEEGKVDTEAFGVGFYANAFDMEVLADGKILVGFTAYEQGDPRFGLARFNEDGSIDGDFGVGGKVSTEFNDGAELRALAVQQDGKILLAGHTVTNQAPYSSDFAIARYLPNGDLDNSFGSGGKLIININSGSTSERAYAMVIQPDGKILLGGDTYPDNITYTDIVLVRLFPNGTLDFTFGNGGIATRHFLGYDHLESIALDMDGNILIAGWAQSDEYGLFARFLPDGSIDPTINSGSGYVFFGNGSGGNDYLLSVQSAPNDKILVAGYSCQDENCFQATAWLFRLDAVNGWTDTDFGNNGQAPGEFGPFDRFDDILVQPDGKILALGMTDLNQGDLDFLVARYLENGQLDSEFGTQGIVITDFEGLGDGIDCGYIQADGKLVVGGRANYSPGNLALARYWLGLNTSVQTPEIQALDLQIFPNPAAERVQASFFLQSETLLHWEWRDVFGKKAFPHATSTFYSSGWHMENIPIPDEMLRGLYLLVVRTDKGDSIAKPVFIE